ncbi:ROK family protein [Clostridium sp. MCC353]|uniref:ROK family transcriptional regulator n=1 Tax=Clostridium sp. MCC353 TaxID=2592646 RepID=UPI001C017319|nr:ROK family transcriptional regulator [Clostridium sp. MCC353]MBT9776451.1 ROK family protein [Clostridium sp. MCC353]
MKMNEKPIEKKRQNKTKIACHILRRKQISRPELASELGISMPTVLQNVKELMDEGIVEEVGEYESTGGRKAKALSVVSDIKFAAGIDITANHVSYIVINLKGETVCQKRSRLRYENLPGYYEDIAVGLHSFLDENRVDRQKILGVGISLPGIIDKENHKLMRSHILNVSDINLESISRLIPYPVQFENDANSAAIAELQGTDQNAVYLSLSNTVGGSIYMNNSIYAGDNFRSAEFGHMMIHPDGKVCYCGKYGCADAYCSANVLTSYVGDEADPADFFRILEQKEPGAVELWSRYLDDLAVVITNLRMAFDCDIVLGGYVGGYLKNYMSELGRKVLNYNKFDNDTLYLRTCSYEKEASAVGIAMTFLDAYFKTFC